MEDFLSIHYSGAGANLRWKTHGFALEKVCDGESFGPLTKRASVSFFCAVKQYTQLEG